jgi:cation diffusion facilitator CzcD-associated flavoprotein CzcO
VHPETNLLIIGAGPFGLAQAAYAHQAGMDYLIVGDPMEFWRRHMPKGMYLRSGSDWHLDPSGHCTIERFLALRGLTPKEVEPLSLECYLSYARWFQEQQHIEPIPARVHAIEPPDDRCGRFLVTLEDGRGVAAKHVVVAVGFQYFRHLPPELIALLPQDRFAHTCDLSDFSALSRKRCLIVGGRQSAFEWAALLHEAGAAAVHVAHRHDSPAFAAADWSWVPPLVERMLHDPGWYRRLPPEERRAVDHRFWAEGRLKVEPWLEARVRRNGIKVWPRTRLVACAERPDGELEATLDNGEVLAIDHVVLATGYKVQIHQVPFLGRGAIRERLRTRADYPVLDERLQTSIAGLFITSMPATQDFGPFFAFTVSARTSATLIGEAIGAG